MLGETFVIHRRYRVCFSVAPAGGDYGALVYAEPLVRDYEIWVYLSYRAYTHTARTRSVRSVEREHPWAQLFKTYAAVVAGVVLRIHKLARLVAQNVYHNKAVRHIESGLDGVGKTLRDPFLDHEPVHYDRDVMFFLFIKLYLIFGYIDHFAVYLGSDETVFTRVFKCLYVLALSASCDRGHNLYPCSLGKGEYRVYDLIDRLRDYHLAAFGTVRHAYPCEDKP